MLGKHSLCFPPRRPSAQPKQGVFLLRKKERLLGIPSCFCHTSEAAATVLLMNQVGDGGAGVVMVVRGSVSVEKWGEVKCE